MKRWRYAAVAVALLSSQGIAAEKWVHVATDTDEDNVDVYVDQNSIQRGSDGLIYFNKSNDYEEDESLAADCQKQLYYVLRDDDHISPPSDYSDWRNHGEAVIAGTIGKAELDYVCANVP